MSDDPFTDPNTPVNPEDRKKRLTFRAWRRGFKEADLIMGRFAEARLETLSPAEIDEFERLLDAPDTEVYGWISGTLETPANYDGPVLDQLKSFRFDENASEGDGPGA
ncbi:MAG: succinate dehydrogenase assembly factor 2 [Oceanicaulis sp.]